MNLKKRFIAIVIFTVLSVFNSLPVTADTTEEVQFLLTFIEKSGCKFIRNGSEHSAEDARKHIERKYDYLGDRIESADEFIRKAASKSSFSGKVYKVECGDQKISSEQWLTTALQDYRVQN